MDPLGAASVAACQGGGGGGCGGGGGDGCGGGGGDGCVPSRLDSKCLWRHCVFV